MALNCLSGSWMVQLGVRCCIWKWRTPKLAFRLGCAMIAIQQPDWSSPLDVKLYILIYDLVGLNHPSPSRLIWGNPILMLVLFDKERTNESQRRCYLRYCTWYSSKKLIIKGLTRIFIVEYQRCRYTHTLHYKRMNLTKRCDRFGFSLRVNDKLLILRVCHLHLHELRLEHTVPQNMAHPAV